MTGWGDVMPGPREDGSAVDLLVTNIGQLATPIGPGPRGGAAQKELTLLDDAAVAVRGDSITWVGSASEWRGEARRTIDAKGRAVIPALVDPHTHAVWAGDRLADFEARAAGVGYEAILARGGGIRHTMRETAAASREDLVLRAHERVMTLARSGAATIEVKSGYGHTPEAELRSLEAIRALAEEMGKRGVTIVATLLVHVPPTVQSDREAYVEEMATRVIPYVAGRRLATAVDVFVEREAFSVAEAGRLLRAAKAHGLGVKLHADQFSAIGGVELATSLGALSVDHLEASGEREIRQLASSRTVATVLPGVTLHLGIPAAPGRALVDAGAAVAVGTDLNPGSSPLFSTQLAMALAVRINGLSPAEALVAGTVNAAAAAGFSDRGRIEAGCRADVLVLDASDWREAAYSLGGSPVAERICGGLPAAS